MSNGNLSTHFLYDWLLTQIILFMFVCFFFNWHVDDVDDHFDDDDVVETVTVDCDDADDDTNTYIYICTYI